MAPKVDIGCAVLHQPTNLREGGWASMAGEPAFRFTSLDSLAARGGVWIASAPEAAFLADGGAAFPFLRHGHYLPTPLLALAQEVGTGDQPDAEQVASRLSEIASRVTSMAADLCGDDGIEKAIHGGQWASLQTAMLHSLNPVNRVERLPQELIANFQSFFKPPQPMGVAGAQDIVVRVPVNRMALAHIVLNASVPAGDWQEIPINQAAPEAEIQRLMELPQGVICQVTTRSVLPRVRSMAPLTRNITPGATRWCALPELIGLAKIVDVVPRRAFVSADIIPAQATLRVPPPVFSPAAYASISAGLLAEAYMHAASTPLPLLGGEPGLVSAGSMRAVWLTAIARSYLLQEALALGEAGMAVVGVGNSFLLVSVHKRHLRTLRKAIAASRLLAFPTGIRSREEDVPSTSQRSLMASELGVG